MTTPRPSKPLDMLQLTIVLGLSLGRTRAQVADDMGVSIAVVRSNIRRARANLGARNEAHLVALTYRTGQLATWVGADDT
jgi:DNA-binding CsgD family transcriptional regulator